MCLSPKTESWEVQGLLSYHGNCSQRPQPSIYNALSEKIINWISNTIGNAQMTKSL